MPARIPITPPTPLMTTASIRNCPRISRRVADRPPYPDLTDPRVTLASMMFMIPMPPTRSEIAAIAASTMLKVRCVARTLFEEFQRHDHIIIPRSPAIRN